MLIMLQSQYISGEDITQAARIQQRGGHWAQRVFCMSVVPYVFALTFPGRMDRSLLESTHAVFVRICINNAALQSADSSRTCRANAQLQTQRTHHLSTRCSVVANERVLTEC